MISRRIGCNTLAPDMEERKAAGFKFPIPKIMGALDSIAAAGFSDVEYSLIYHLTVPQASELGAYARSKGLNNWSCHSAGPTGHANATVEEAFTANRRCVDITSAIGAGVLVHHIWNFERDDAMRILDNLVPYAADRKIDIALENYDTLRNMEYILSLVHDFNAPNLGINVDTGHANLGDLGAGRALRMAGSKLFTTHLHDNFGKHDDHMPPGTGAVDWPDVAKAFTEIGYQRTLMVELTDRLVAPREYDQPGEIQAAFRFMSNFPAPR